MLCEKCNIELIRKDFNTQYILYCTECVFVSSKFDICEHDYKPVIVVVSNGTKRIMMLCNKCHKKQAGGRNYKMSDYKLNELRTINNEKYHNYWNEKEITESQEIWEFIKQIRQNNYEKIKEERQSEYTEYLQSVGWKNVRSEIMDRDNNTCQICGGTAIDVHHLTYKHLGKEFLFELISLCRNCHLTQYHEDQITIHE